MQGPSERRVGAAPPHGEILRKQEAGQRKKQLPGNWAGGWARGGTYSLQGRLESTAVDKRAVSLWS